MSAELLKSHLLRQLRAEILRSTGKQYQISFEALDARGLQEFIRLLRDLDYLCTARINRAHTMPWRQA